MQIDKGIPLPAPDTEGCWDFLNDMDVGDSFFLDRLGDRSESAARSAIVNHTNRTGWRFTSRTVIGGVRFWRAE